MDAISSARAKAPNPRDVPANSSIGHMLGNTMSLNVIERVLCKALPAAGLAAKLNDRWS